MQKVKGPRSIVAICNPLIDMTMEVQDKAFLDNYRLKNGHAILAQEKIHKELLQEVWRRSKTENVVVAPGGSGLNTIRAANVRYQ